MGADYTGWIFHRLCPNAFAMMAFLHLLYVVPHRTEDEQRKYADAFSECKRLNRSVSKQLLMLCYNELSRKYQGCLLYLTIFPEGHVTISPFTTEQGCKNPIQIVTGKAL